jgi:hypothetical protein
LAIQFAYSAWEFGRCIGAYNSCERSEVIVDSESFLKKRMAAKALNSSSIAIQRAPNDAPSWRGLIDAGIMTNEDKK